MGYRSTVVLAVDNEIMPAFMAALSQEPRATELVFSEHDELIKDYGGEGNILIKWDGIKWYETYPEISKITQFLNDPTDFGAVEDWEEHLTFVRIGEDMTDNEQVGYGFDDIYISRSMEY